MTNEIAKDPTTQNTIMFASTVPTIFDSIHSSIHQTIRSQVSTLPIIQSSSSSSNELSCEDKIYNQISKVYSKHMDVAQLYAQNELFCLDKHLTRKKREHIVNAFLTLEQRGALSPADVNEVDGDGDNDDDNDNDDGGEDNRQAQAQAQEEEIKFRYKIPESKQHIPNAEEMAEVKEEIIQLRQQLRHAIIEKQKLRQKIQFIEEAKVSSADIDGSISKIIGAVGGGGGGGRLGQSDGDGRIVQSVKAANEGKKQLKELTSTGQQLIEQMDYLAENKAKEGNHETEEFSEAMKAKALEVGRSLERESRPMKRTLEEEYKERKEKVVVQGNVHVMKLFKK